MGSESRKLKRNKIKKAKKDMKEKVALFDKLPDHCLTCEATFDKKDAKQVQTWNVVVRDDTVRLYCPECWDRAIKLVEEFKNHLGSKK
tara:strand:- start:65 stop:328 length:264 start_codon:yes stop_codon:yes gene_type:complete